MATKEYQLIQTRVDAYKADPSIANRNAVLEACVPFLKPYARQLARGYRDIFAEDLVQDAVLRLYGKLERYDPARGLQFWTYAGGPSLKGGMLDYIRNAHCNKHRAEGIPHPEWLVDHRTNGREECGLPRWLTQRQRLLIIQRFWMDYTYADLGEFFGVTKQCICNWMGALINEWREREGLAPRTDRATHLVMNRRASKWDCSLEAERATKSKKQRQDRASLTPPITTAA